jgi:hypothetical protein
MRSRHSVVCIFGLPNNSPQPTWPARHRCWRSSVSLGWPGGSARCRYNRGRTAAFAETHAEQWGALTRSRFRVALSPGSTGLSARRGEKRNE